MDPFAAAGAGSMEELRRADEHKRQQQRIAALESEVLRLKSSLGEAQNQVKKAEATAATATAAAAVASIASAGTESSRNTRGGAPRQRQPAAAAVPLPAASPPSQSAGDASGNARVQELEATLAAIQRDVDARDEQWRASVGELTKRFNERLARAQQRQQQQAPLAGGGVRPSAGMSNVSPTPAAAASSGDGASASAALLESLVASVDGLRADMRTVKANVASLSAAADSGAAIVVASPATGTSARGGRAVGTRAQKSIFDRLGPGIEADPATESAPRNVASFQVAETKGASEAATAATATVTARSAGPRFGDKTAPKPQLALPATAAGTSSEAAAPVKRRGRPPKNAAPAAPSAVDVASEAEARRRKELVAEAVRNADRGSATAAARSAGPAAAAARGSNEDLIGAYLAQRSQPNLTMRQTDDLRRKYTALASGIADARGTSAAVVLADKFYDMIAANAAGWRDKQRTDTARTAMLHSLEPLAFRSAFRDVAVARVVEGIRWAAESAGGGAEDGDRVAPATSDPVVAHEVAACGAGWLVQESDANAHGAFWFDVALAGLRTLRRVRDPAAKRTACSCLVAALRGLCRGSALVAGINSHRATLVGIAIQTHVTAVVCPLLSSDEGTTAAAREWWLELCALLDWPPQPSASAATPLLEERIRTVAARNRTLNQQSVDAVLAMRVVAQGISAGVELLYELARDAVNNVSPPMVLLIASLSLDFELAFTDSDRVIAAYLVSSFKGHSFAEVDTPAQIVAAVAVLTCSPVPPKSTAAFASEIVAAAGHVRHLARKQHTTPSIRPIVSTAVGRAIIAEVDRFIQLPTAV